MTICDNCPHFSTGCGFVYIGGIPYCQREINGKTISTDTTEADNNVLEANG